MKRDMMLFEQILKKVNEPKKNVDKDENGLVIFCSRMVSNQWEMDKKKAKCKVNQILLFFIALRCTTTLHIIIPRWLPRIPPHSRPAPNSGGG